MSLLDLQTDGHCENPKCGEFVSWQHQFCAKCRAAGHKVTPPTREEIAENERVRESMRERCGR